MIPFRSPKPCISGEHPTRTDSRWDVPGGHQAHQAVGCWMLLTHHRFRHQHTTQAAPALQARSAAVVEVVAVGPCNSVGTWQLHNSGVHRWSLLVHAKIKWSETMGGFCGSHGCLWFWILVSQATFNKWSRPSRKITIHKQLEYIILTTLTIVPAHRWLPAAELRHPTASTMSSASSEARLMVWTASPANHASKGSKSLLASIN